MKILIVAATNLEIEPSIQFLKSHFSVIGNNEYLNKEVRINVLITGVGMVATAFQLGKHMAKDKFDLVVNAGIAGAFSPSLTLGDVVQVTNETFYELGAEDKDGSFLSIFDLSLVGQNDFPFTNKKLINLTENAQLQKVSGLTVQKVHGCEQSISGALVTHPADVESMEGAAFFYCCLLGNVQFLQIRAISNYVEPRNRKNWDIPTAILHLNNFLITSFKEGFNLTSDGARD